MIQKWLFSFETFPRLFQMHFEYVMFHWMDPKPLSNIVLINKRPHLYGNYTWPPSLLSRNVFNVQKFPFNQPITAQKRYVSKKRQHYFLVYNCCCALSVGILSLINVRFKKKYHYCSFFFQSGGYVLGFRIDPAEKLQEAAKEIQSLQKEVHISLQRFIRSS